MDGDTPKPRSGLFDSSTPLRSASSKPKTDPDGRPRGAFDDVPGLDGEPTAGLAKVRDADRHPDSPFAPITAQIPVLPKPRLERLLDVAFKWRTPLGLGLAAIITLAVVIAYRAPDSAQSLVSTELVGSESRTAQSVAEFANDGTVPAGPSQSPAADRQVNSAVDEADVPTSTATTAAATTASPTTTAAPSTTVETTESTEATVTTPAVTEPETTASSTPLSTGATAASSTTIAAGQLTRIEAETGDLLGTARARSDHSGYSGTGFVGDIITVGSGVSLQVESTGGPTPFTVRYSAGNNGPDGLRTLSVLVDGEFVSEAQMRPTADWDNWDVVVGAVTLMPGTNTITLIWDDNDTGWANIDYVEIN